MQSSIVLKYTVSPTTLQHTITLGKGSFCDFLLPDIVNLTAPTTLG